MKELLAKLKHKKGSLQTVEPRMGILGGTVQSFRDKVRKTKAQQDLNLSRDVKDTMGFYCMQVTRGRLEKTQAYC